MILTWHLIEQRMDPPTGGECSECQCDQHPRVSRLTQRPNRDAEWITTYEVAGIAAQHYASAAEALAAMRSNPR